MSNPFHETLARRIAVQQAAVANVTDDDLGAVVRMLAIAAATGDARALARIASASPNMRAIIEAEVDIVIAEQQATLAERRREAGVTVPVDSPRPAEAIQPAPEIENAPVTTAESFSGHVTPPGCRPKLEEQRGGLPPPGTVVDYSGRTRPVPPPFTAKRYGLKEVTRGESNVGWMWNR